MDIRILIFIKTCKDIWCCVGERKKWQNHLFSEGDSWLASNIFSEYSRNVWGRHCYCYKRFAAIEAKKIPANQRIIQPLFITSRRFVSLAKRSFSGKRWACDISACWNRCVKCHLVLWVSKALRTKHRKNTIFYLAMKEEEKRSLKFPKTCCVCRKTFAVKSDVLGSTISL